MVSRSSSRKFVVSREDPTEKVLYLGCSQVYPAPMEYDVNMSDDVVYLLRKEHLCKVSPNQILSQLTISNKGISLHTNEADSPNDLFFPISAILFCKAEKNPDNAFSWVEGNSNEGFYCHVVLCSSRREAMSAAVTLKENFEMNLHEISFMNRNRGYKM